MEAYKTLLAMTMSLGGLYNHTTCFFFLFSSPPDAEDHIASSSNTNDLSWPQEFLRIFSPHKLFLNFVEFVDFDHLVLSDFLISPETSFLPYFITYLHVHHILEDWITFKSTAVGSAQEKGFLETVSISKCVNNRKSKEGNITFTDVNSSLQQMTYKTSIDKTGTQGCKSFRFSLISDFFIKLNLRELELT